MSRIPAVDPSTASGHVKTMLDGVQKGLGVTPNMFRVAAQSSPVLEALTSTFGAASKGHLDAKTREAIALTVSEIDGCDYCLSAHSYLGLNLAKITPEEIALNRKGQSGDAKADAAVRFATQVVRERGQVDEGDIQRVRDAGFSDGQIVEIIAVTAENIFTNLLNVVAQTDIDFPMVHAAELA